MHISPLPPYEGFLAFCDAGCAEVYADAETDDTLVSQIIAVANGLGPPWCLHCHTCGQRCWTSLQCPLCADCDEPRWSITATAARFAAALERYHLPDVPPNAWQRGERLCTIGLHPRLAAHLVAGRYAP